MSLITPKAFANFSPGLERKRQPWDRVRRRAQTLTGFANCRTLSGLSSLLECEPRVVAALQPRAEISERLRRNSNCITTRSRHRQIRLLLLQPCGPIRDHCRWSWYRLPDRFTDHKAVGECHCYFVSCLCLKSSFHSHRALARWWKTGTRRKPFQRFSRPSTTLRRPPACRDAD